jgi:hypothetical protein
MEEVASTPKLVDPADVDAKGGLTATLPRSDIESALQDDAGADLLLEIARIQNGERDDRKVRVAWEKSELEDLLRRASGDHITLTFSQAEVERMLDDPDVEAQGLRETALVLTVAAATAAGFAGSAAAHVMGEGGSGTGSAAVSGLVTDASTGGIPGSVASIATDASTGGATGAAADPTAAPADGWMSGAESPVPASTPADGWMSGVESPVGANPAGINVVTDNTGGQPGSVSGFATDATTSGQPGSVTGIISDTGSEATRNPAQPAVGGGGSGFSIPDSAIEGALAGGLALLITGAAFVTRTQRRRPSTA